MASAQDYAAWIVKNADKKGTPEFDTVVKAYQIAKTQGAQPAAPQTAAAPNTLGRGTQKEEPILPYAWNQFKQGFAGVPALAGMATEALTLPSRLATRATMNVISGKKPQANIGEAVAPASKLYATGAPEMLNYKPNMPVPKDIYGKPRIAAEVAGNITGFAGASVLPGAGVVSKSARPLTALAKEVAGVVLGGEGQAMGAHMAPEKYKAVGEFAGSLMGPGLAQGAVEMASKGGNWVKTGAKALGFTGLTEQARLEAGARKAAQELGPQLASPAAKAGAANVTRIGEKIPGFRENITLGRQTGSPVIQAMEKHFGTTVPSAMELGQQRQQGLQSAIGKYAERRFPSAPEGVTPTQGAVRAVESKIAKLDEATARLQHQESSLASRMARGDMEDIGAEVKAVRDRLMQTAKKAAEERYRAVYDVADQQGLKVNMDDVKSLAAKINADAGNAFQDKPGVIGKILAKYRAKVAPEKDITTTIGKKIHLRTLQEEPAKPVSFEEFHSLYKEANREASELGIAARMGNQEAAQKLRYVNAIKEQLQAKITEMEGPQYGEVGKLLKDANSYYRTKYAALFKRGVGGEMARTNRFGPSTENAKLIPRLIFRPGDASGVKEYLTMAQGDPQAYRALENGVMDMVSKAAVKDGKISKTALDSFLKTYHEPLSAVPGIRKEIETVQKAAAALARNRQLITAEQSAFGKSIIAKIAKTENPQDVVSKAITSPNTMKALFATATSPEERQAVAHSVMETIAKQTDPLKYLSENEGLLTQSLGKKQVGFLKTIFEAQKIANSVEAPTYLAYEKLQDPLSRAIGTTIPQAVSEAKMVQLRMGSRAYALARVGVRFWNKLRNDKRDEILMDAIYNPEMAAALAKYINEPTAKAASDLNAHLMAYGVRAGVLGYTLTKPDQAETKKQETKPGKINMSLPMPRKTGNDYPYVPNYSGPPRG